MGVYQIICCIVNLGQEIISEKSFKCCPNVLSIFTHEMESMIPQTWYSVYSLFNGNKMKCADSSVSNEKRGRQFTANRLGTDCGLFQGSCLFTAGTNLQS
jgi:hypothetical protein